MVKRLKAIDNLRDQVELKVKETAGKDGITAEKMNREVLPELWWELFSWCWTSGMVPSVWRSIVVPFQKRGTRDCVGRGFSRYVSHWYQ